MKRKGRLQPVVRALWQSNKQNRQFVKELADAANEIFLKSAQPVPELQYFVQKRSLSKYELRDFNHVGHLKPVGRDWFLINHPSTRAMQALIGSGRTISQMNLQPQITLAIPVLTGIDLTVDEDIDDTKPAAVRAVIDLTVDEDIDDTKFAALLAGIDLTVDEDIDGTKPAAVRAVTDDTSSQPGIKYIETVRNREERARLPAYFCDECRNWYAHIERTHGEDFSCYCRHRARFAPAETPPDYWEMSFIDEIRAREAKGDGE